MCLHRTLRTPAWALALIPSLFAFTLAKPAWVFAQAAPSPAASPQPTPAPPPAPESPPESTPPVQPGLTAPVLVERAEPVYPEAARKAGIGGTVGLELNINGDGVVTDARVVHGPALRHG